MAKKSLKWIALLGGVTLGTASVAVAQDGKAVLDALVKKGVLTTEEAAQITKDAKPSTYAMPGSSSVTKLQINGRVQARYDNFTTDDELDGLLGDIPTSGNFFMRRVRLGVKAEFGPDFEGVINYDFLATGALDVAYVRYKGFDDHTIDVGFKKVNFGVEENTSSASLKAIERSPVTRYFVESNNGRRLGGGSRRMGIFTDGTAGNVFYGAAVTNIERQSDPGFGGRSGNPGNSGVALWANGGLKGKFDNGSYTVGAALGFLPEQVENGVLVNDSLLVTSLYSTFTVGSFSLLGEVLWSDNDAGAGSNAYGFTLQPSVALSKQLELVARLSYLDTDGRNVSVTDVIPSTNSARENFDSMYEVYAGFNYLFAKDNVKFSAGVVYAKFEDGATTGGDADVLGLRTQMQVSF